MTPPILRVGWQTDQSANSKDLTFSLDNRKYRANPRLADASASNLLNGDGTTLITNLKAPYFPSSTGFIDRAQVGAVLTTPAPPTPPTDFDPAYTPLAQKYQYWAVKFKPYVETQFVMTNKIYLDQILQIDFTFNLESFKAYLWGDAAVWYQYDSTNPENPVDSGWTTNYRNYFLCTDSGITVKPILMSINLSIKLRNCYKTLIQSLTDWSNWTKIGPNTAYFGILDYCKASEAESVTIFSWNPVSSDYNVPFWGNTDNGNPQIDWEGMETGTVVTANRWKFDYCNQLVGNDYDLNQGGKFGDLYCAAAAAPASSTWIIFDAAKAASSNSASAATANYDRTISSASCV